MSALATEHKAVNLGQGFPDFPMNQELIGLVEKAMREDFNQYAPMQGYLPLREMLSQKYILFIIPLLIPIRKSLSHQAVPMPYIQHLLLCYAPVMK